MHQKYWHKPEQEPWGLAAPRTLKAEAEIEISELRGHLPEKGDPNYPEIRAALHSASRWGAEKIWIYPGGRAGGSPQSDGEREVAVLATSRSQLTIRVPERFAEIPPGDYWLRHDSNATVCAGGGIIGYGLAAPSEKIPQEVDLLVCRPVKPTPSGDPQIQVQQIIYSDDFSSDGAGQIVEIVPVGGYPRLEFEPSDHEFDPTQTRFERWNAAASFREERLLEGLAYSGYYGDPGHLFTKEELKAKPFRPVENTRIHVAEHSIFGRIYLGWIGNAQVAWGSPEAIQAIWRKYQGEYSPQDSRDWIEKYRGCGGHEFHEWNASSSGEIL